MEDTGQKTYEIAVENRAHMVFIREQITVLKQELSEVRKLHQDCPGRLHAIRSEGAASWWSRAAMAVGMVGSMIASAIALFKVKGG
jgi:hypothetical protein